MKKVVMGSLLLALAGCNFVDPDKGILNFSEKGKTIINPIKTGTDVSTETVKDLVFLDLQKDLFNHSCMNCHNSENALKKNRFDLTKKEVILENYDKILYSMTTAFDVGVNFMPPKGRERVSPELINQLQAWKADSKYQNLQKQLFVASCTTCHNTITPKGKLDLTSKDAIVAKYDRIIYRMTDAFGEATGKPMPPRGKGERVSEALVKELRDWKEAH